MKHFVFVYGSLKIGFHNDMLLSSAEYLGDSITMDKYLMESYGRVPILHKDAHHHICGEIYAVNDDELERLDILEGNGTHYKRELIYLYDGELVWCYFLMEHHRFDELIDDGHRIVVKNEKATWT